MPNGTRHNPAMPLGGLPLDQHSSVPLHRQLCDRLREAILSGQLVAGIRLPGTRTLATELGISRNTVLNAFEQLLAEGYVEGKVGAGTYVACNLPETMLQVRSDAPQSPATPQRRRGLSRRGEQIATTSIHTSHVMGEVRAFQPGLPAIDAFPFALWSRLAARRWRHPSAELLGYGDPAGYRPLREAIATYLQTGRGVRCAADQVIIVAGSQQAVNLVTRLLLDPGDVAWVENPGYCGIRGALHSAEARMVPVPVDEEGLDVAAGIARCPDARFVYVSPSHQYPTGAVMSLQRRLSLLEWAEQADAWVLEDDYDSEFRYAGRPLSALQGLDCSGRVIYMGTFSKVLLPTLRIGYIVAPPDLVDAFVTARALIDLHSPSLDQAILTDFITEGHFSHHIRRMRTLYAERQAMLIEEARREFDGLLDLSPDETGLHLLGWLPTGMDDQAVAHQAAALGVQVRALSTECIEPVQRGGLLLGYGAVDQMEIRAGIQRLAKAIARVAQPWPLCALPSEHEAAS